MTTVTLVEGPFNILVFSAETRAEADAFIEDLLTEPGIGTFTYDEATRSWVSGDRTIQIGN